MDLQASLVIALTTADDGTVTGSPSLQADDGTVLQQWDDFPIGGTSAIHFGPVAVQYSVSADFYTDTAGAAARRSELPAGAGGHAPPAPAHPGRPVPPARPPVRPPIRPPQRPAGK